MRFIEHGSNDDTELAPAGERDAPLPAVFLGIVVLLGSVPAWLVMVDDDYHFSYEGQVGEVSFEQELRTSPYGQLSAEKQRIVDSAVNGRTFDFEDGGRSLPAFVRRGDVYHQFDSRRAIDWTNPGSFVPIAVGVVGVLILSDRNTRISNGRRRWTATGYSSFVSETVLSDSTIVIEAIQQERANLGPAGY